MSTSEITNSLFTGLQDHSKINSKIKGNTQKVSIYMHMPLDLITTKYKF